MQTQTIDTEFGFLIYKLGMKCSAHKREIIQAGKTEEHHNCQNPLGLLAPSKILWSFEITPPEYSTTHSQIPGNALMSLSQKTN